LYNLWQKIYGEHPFEIQYQFQFVSFFSVLDDHFLGSISINQRDEIIVPRC